MSSDVSGILVMVLVLTAALAFGLFHFRRPFTWLYTYVAVLWVVSLFLFSVGLSSRGMLQLIYPWAVPLLFLMPTCVQLFTNSLLKTKSEDWVFYVLYLMPIFSTVSAFGTVADPELYERNVAHLFAGSILEVHHVLGSFTSSFTYLTSFSMVHSILLIRRVRDARFTGPSWLYWSLPTLHLILSAGGLCAIIIHVLGFASGQFMFTVLSVVSIAVGAYIVILSRYEKRKLTTVISDALFFAPSKHSAIETFLRNLEGDTVRGLFQDFTKPKLASMSLIPTTEWDAFLTEQRFSWPDFKNRVRIRYALQELNSAYLATKTVESLSLELGFQSRKSFYTAFEAVTGESFRGEVYR
jgi:hypothetical protein